jgi:hypothetical protein
MNHRSSLFALGTLGLLATAAIACGPRPVPPYIEVRVAPKSDPFTIEEFTTKGQSFVSTGQPVVFVGQSAGALQAAEERGLALFLTRTVKDPAAPKEIRLIVPDGCTFERVWMAVRAAKAAGVTQVRYFGCLPPGCGLLVGAKANQERHAGTVYKIEDLIQIFEVVAMLC